MLASRESGVLGFKMWPLGTQLKINSLPEMEDRKVCFCSNLIKMSLCDAFLKKPRIDTTEDFLRCPLLSGAGPQGNPVSVVGQATEVRRQEPVLPLL